MADNTSGEPATPQTNAPSASGPVTTGSEPQAAPPEWFQSYVKAQDEKMGKLSAIIRRQTKGSTSQPETKPATATTTAPATTASQPNDTLTARFAKMESELKAEREKNAETKRRAAIETSIASHGLDDINAKLVRAYVFQEYGASIKIDDEGVFQDRDEMDGGPRPVSDLIGDVMKTFGNRFKPPVNTPRAPRGNAPQPTTMKPYHELTPAERAKMSPAEKNAYADKYLSENQG